MAKNKKANLSISHAETRKYFSWKTARDEFLNAERPYESKIRFSIHNFRANTSIWQVECNLANNKSSFI